MKRAVRATRVALLGALRRSPAWRAVTGVPQHGATPVRDYAAAHDAPYVAVHPAHVVDTGAWQAASVEPVDPFDASGLIELPATYVARLRDVRLHARGVAVIGADGGVLSGVTVHFNAPLAEHGVYRRAWLPRAQRLDGRSALLSAAGGNTYYHWMLDVLPRLELLRLAGHDIASVAHVVVNSTRAPFQQETLARVGIDMRRVVSSDEARHLSMHDALVPSHPGPFLHPPAWAVRWLARTFLGDVSPHARAPGDGSLLYLTRQEARRRRIHNGDEVERALIALGFEVLEPEGMTVAEQAARFRGARALVAAHGSALTNLAFCLPGTAVIELFQPDDVPPFYWFLANGLGLRYQALVGTRGPAEDIVVDVPALQRRVEAQLAAT